ncbi:hypothetical protein BC826DRAFT_970216 [Russula brevipes]|nr:hypothetical protein BC826DRAFT_970216 [Russula brevipes]
MKQNEIERMKEAVGRRVHCNKNSRCAMQDPVACLELVSSRHRAFVPSGEQGTTAQTLAGDANPENVPGDVVTSPGKLNLIFVHSPKETTSRAGLIGFPIPSGASDFEQLGTRTGRRNASGTPMWWVLQYNEALSKVTPAGDFCGLLVERVPHKLHFLNSSGPPALTYMGLRLSHSGTHHEHSLLKGSRVLAHPFRDLPNATNNVKGATNLRSGELEFVAERKTQKKRQNSQPCQPEGIPTVQVKVNTVKGIARTEAATPFLTEQCLGLTASPIIGVMIGAYHAWPSRGREWQRRLSNAKDRQRSRVSLPHPLPRYLAQTDWSRSKSTASETLNPESKKISPRLLSKKEWVASRPRHGMLPIHQHKIGTQPVPIACSYSTVVMTRFKSETPYYIGVALTCSPT